MRFYNDIPHTLSQQFIHIIVLLLPSLITLIDYFPFSLSQSLLHHQQIEIICMDRNVSRKRYRGPTSPIVLQLKINKISQFGGLL